MATFMYTSYVEPAPHETTPICTGAPPRITTSGPPLSPSRHHRVARPPVGRVVPVLPVLSILIVLLILAVLIVIRLRSSARSNDRQTAETSRP